MAWFWEMSRQNVIDSLPMDSATLLEYGVVHSSFNFKIHRSTGFVIVEANSKFVTIFIPVDGVPINCQQVRIKIEAMHRVGQIRHSRAKFVDFQVPADKIADR